jgi:hypothetical protein
LKGRGVFLLGDGVVDSVVGVCGVWGWVLFFLFFYLSALVKLREVGFCHSFLGLFLFVAADESSAFSDLLHYFNNNFYILVLSKIK